MGSCLCQGQSQSRSKRTDYGERHVSDTAYAPYNATARAQRHVHMCIQQYTDAYILNRGRHACVHMLNLIQPY